MTNEKLTANDVAVRIDQARKVAGKSIADVALGVGIGDKTLQRKRHAPEKYTLGELLRIASVLNIEPETLFTTDAHREQLAS